jgi:hypothetical protein
MPVEVRVIFASERALLVDLGDGDEVWIPFSIIFEDDLVGIEIGETTEINVASWFVEREGLS